MLHEFHRWKPFSTHVEPLSLTIFPGMRSFSEKLIWIFLIVTLLMNSTLVLWTLHVSNYNRNRAIIRFSWRLQIKKKIREFATNSVSPLCSGLVTESCNRKIINICSLSPFSKTWYACFFSAMWKFSWQYSASRELHFIMFRTFVVLMLCELKSCYLSTTREIYPRECS